MIRASTPAHENPTLRAFDLCRMGREPAASFRTVLENGGEVSVMRLLRVLPGKRIVGEGLWLGRRVLAKFFVSSSSDRHSANEVKGIEALRLAGIPTPDLLAAERLRDGGNAVLTKFLEGAQSLAEAWERGAGFAADHRASAEVLMPAFSLLGRMHASGLIQADLHLGNFLLHEGKVYVIDGDSVRAVSPGKALDEKQAISNLAILLAQLPTAWDAWRTDFLDAYRSGGGCRITDMACLESETSRVRKWRLIDYLGKTIRDCTLFAITRSAFRFTAVQREQANRLAPLLESPDQVILRGQLLKDGRTCTVTRVEQTGRPLVIKRYNLKNLRHVLERFWRPTRAWHSWREGHRLRFLGIPTPAPLALVEERLGPLRRRAFLITEYCPGINLLTFLSPDQAPGEEVANAIISLFQTLHGLHISHGDLKATNLLWHSGRVFVIDLDAVVQHRSASGYARSWRRDRARLLRNWPASSVLHQWLANHLPPVSA